MRDATTASCSGVGHIEVAIEELRPRGHPPPE
jgi:hypothetical protein